MQLCVLDFETYWDKETYSLSGMGVEEYVRDPRFHPLLLSVKLNDGPIRVFEEEQIGQVLKALPLSNPEVYTACQNYSFDGFIIENHYHIPVANPICARALCRLTGVSRLTGESLSAQNAFFGYGKKEKGTVVSNGKHREDFTPEEWAFFKKYNAEDTEQTHHHVTMMLNKLFEWLSFEQLKYFLKFDSITENMYTQPRIELDKDLLTSYEAGLVAKQEVAMHKLQHLFSFPDQESFVKAIRSRGRTVAKLKGLPTFMVMLEMLGVQIPLKVSEKRAESMSVSKKWITDFVGKLKQESYYSEDDLKSYKKHRKNIEKGELTPALAKTDDKFMALLEHPNPDVALLCQTRSEINSSIELSRCRTLLGVAKRGTLPVSLSAYQALTGRYTADNSDQDTKSDATNCQNLSSRTGDHTLKRSLRAASGYVLVGADSSQIEARVNAFIWQQLDLLEVFADESRDVYCEFGSILYDRPITKADKKERNASKTTFLQLGYQSSARLLAEKLRQVHLDISTETASHEDECKRFTDIYRDTYFKIKNGWGQCKSIIKDMARGEWGVFGGPGEDLFVYNGADNIFGHPAASITLPDGFIIWLPNLRYVRAGELVSEGLEADNGGFWFDTYNRRTKKMRPSRIYGGKLCAFCCQALAFAIIRWQMLEIGRAWQVVLNVHDSIIVTVPETLGPQDVLDKILEIMRTSPPWLPKGLPLNAEGAYGRSYDEI